MNTDEIKVGNSYSMMPINGRRTIVRVTNLFKITAMAANKEHEIETLELNPTVVRFVWRHAAYPTGCSRRQQQLLLDDFALAAEKLVSRATAASRRPGLSRKLENGSLPLRAG